VCLSTNTMPSARLNEAPVGQTSTQGGFSQCWHIIGKDVLLPVCGFLTSIFLIHCASVSGLPKPRKPFSFAQADTQSSQPLSQRPRSISIPQRTSLETAVSRTRASADEDLEIAYKTTPGASVTPAAVAIAPRKLRLEGLMPDELVTLAESLVLFIFLLISLHLRARCMALETIDADSRIIVT